MYLNFSLEQCFWKNKLSTIVYTISDEPEFEVESFANSINDFFLTSFVLQQTFCSFDREKMPGKIFSKDSTIPNLWNINFYNRETDHVDVVGKEIILTIDAFFNELGNKNFTSKTENFTPIMMRKELEDILKDELGSLYKETLPVLRALSQKKMEFSIFIKAKTTIDKIQKQKTFADLILFLTDKSVFSKGLNDFKSFIDKKIGKRVFQMEKESLKRYTSFFEGKVIISGGGTYIYKLSYDYFMNIFGLNYEKGK